MSASMMWPLACLEHTSAILQEWRSAIVQQQVCHAIMTSCNTLVQGSHAIRPQGDMMHICSMPRQLHQHKVSALQHLHGTKSQHETSGMRWKGAHQLCTLVVSFGRGYEEGCP